MLHQKSVKRSAGKYRNSVCGLIPYRSHVAIVCNGKISIHGGFNDSYRIFQRRKLSITHTYGRNGC